jgi:hypothetical protein
MLLLLVDDTKTAGSSQPAPIGAALGAALDWSLEFERRLR